MVPVNYLVDASNVVLRSLSGGKLDAAAVGSPVAFQIDDHDPSRGTGWSVLIRGRAVIVDEPAAIARYETELDSWGAHDAADASWVRIVAGEISGRRLRRAS